MASGWAQLYQGDAMDPNFLSFSFCFPLFPFVSFPFVLFRFLSFLDDNGIRGAQWYQGGAMVSGERNGP